MYIHALLHMYEVNTVSANNIKLYKGKGKVVCVLN